MFGRGVYLPLALVAAIALPYLLSRDGEQSKTSWSQWISGLFHDDHPGTAGDRTNGNSVPGPTSASYVLPPPVLQLLDEPEFRPTGPIVQNPVELFRFDVTPAWVLTSWPRVTTHLWEDDLEGMRVAVVSGTNPYDVVGSLTYYFDRRQVAQRIRFFGYTGDPAPLMNALIATYQMRPESMLGGVQYVSRSNNLPTNVVRIEHGTFVHADNSWHRLRIELELNRPGRTPALSPSFSKYVEESPIANGTPPAS